MGQLLRPPTLVYPTKVVRLIWPNVGLRAHQDFIGLQGTADAFIAWVPLGDCPKELGAVRVVPGSHHRGLRPQKGISVDPAEFTGQWAGADMRAGDVLVFHSLTVHKAPNNKTDRIRLAVDFRYQSLMDPVRDAWLRPEFHHGPNGWDDVTRGWSSRRWVETPPGTVVMEDIPPSQWRIRRLPASRFARNANPE